MEKTFKAYRVFEEDGKFISAIQDIETSKIIDNELLIKVYYSNLNYKDALSARGNKGVTKKYPHTPGIDAAGVVVNSSVDQFHSGDEVIVSCYDLGMNTDGGFGEYISVPANWVFRLPEGLTMKEAMALGTAGFTAGMCVMNLAEKIKPADGKIIVSGATGGVGSTAISILNKLGYKAVALTGKLSESDYLSRIGATEIISRTDFENLANKALLKSLFAGGVDTVGGIILENMIKSVQSFGVVTCCGNVASPNLNLTVFPFILRGISLVGVDAQNYPINRREKVWQKLAEPWKPVHLSEAYYEVIPLEMLDEKIELMLQGKLKRRVVVKHADN